ncbi:LuxR C-terminal-related transcriptional regulator [Kitasatospora sp. NPDC008050]|uniref:LuxR C-terminal-related transcriptional regulator n=1 Tax=Kitasatospora sp. NPDC008050 TaxID=3364021 RepID=UPI0036E00957
MPGTVARPGADEVPRQLAGYAEGALDALSAEELDVAQAAVVLGDPFEPLLTAAVAARDASSVLAVLDVLAERGVVRAEDGGPLFRFGDPRLRALLDARIRPGWRIGAHTRAARALGEAGASPVDRAPHVVRSAAFGDVVAARVLADAADLVLESAPARALDWLRAARRIVPGDADGALRGRLALALCLAAERTGQHATCREVLPELAGAADRVVVAELRARLAVDRGRHREARVLLEGELHAVPASTGSRGVAALRLQLAALAAFRGKLREVRAWLAQGVTEQPELALDAAAVLALGGAVAGDEAAFREGAAPAQALLAALGDTALSGRLHAALRLGWAAATMNRYEDARSLFARGCRVAARTGRVGMLPRLLLGRGYAELALGGIDRASRSAAAAEAVARELGRADLAGFALVLRAVAVAWHHGPDAARLLAERVPRGAGTHPALRAAADAVLGPAVSSGHASPVRQQRARRPAGWSLWWAAAPGAVDGVGRAVEEVDAAGPSGRAAIALCGRAQDASGVEAVALLRGAVVRFADCGMALHECRARLLLAGRLAESGRLADSLAQAELAKALAERVGSDWLRGLAINQQRSIGARRPRPGAGDATVAVLSEREREIVRMVRLGLPNREIASGLFVSAKTVEAHLTRIFRKTGVRSRTALAAVALSEAGAPRVSPSHPAPGPG